MRFHSKLVSLAGSALLATTMLTTNALAIEAGEGYLSLSGGVLFTEDDGRDAGKAESEADFGKITFGTLLNKNFAFELEFFRGDIAIKDNDGRYQLTGFIGDLKWYPFRGDTGLSPYLSLGAGFQETEQSGVNTTSAVMETAIGLQWWPTRYLGFHTEAGYRLDLYDDPNGGEDYLDEFTFLVGVDVGLPQFRHGTGSHWWNDRSSVGHGPYLGLMAMYVFTDEEPEARIGTDDSFGGHFLFGLPLGEYVNLELKAFYVDFNTDGDFDYEQYGGGVDALFFPFGRDFRIAPYGQLGAAYVHNDVEDFDSDNGLADAGIGMLINVSETVSVRAETRYRVDFFDTDTDSDVTELQELVINLGMNVALLPTRGDMSRDPARRPAPTPTTDDDKDGILNVNDRCPGTVFGTQVDEFGCPMNDIDNAVPQKSYTIYFLRGETTLDANDKSALDDIAATAIDTQANKVLVTGHTDTEGDSGKNVNIAKARADAAAAYLRDQGVTAEIEVLSLSEFSPATRGSSTKERALNRRVEIYLE